MILSEWIILGEFIKTFSSFWSITRQQWLDINRSIKIIRKGITLIILSSFWSRRILRFHKLHRNRKNFHMCSFIDKRVIHFLANEFDFAILLFVYFIIISFYSRLGFLFCPPGYYGQLTLFPKFLRFYFGSYSKTICRSIFEEYIISIHLLPPTFCYRPQIGQNHRHFQSSTAGGRNPGLVLEKHTSQR